MNGYQQFSEKNAPANWAWMGFTKEKFQLNCPNQRIEFCPLQRLRQWMDNIQIHDRNQAHWICKTIPSQCPFERDIQVLGRTLLHIPPLCKLNPFYEQFVALRFRALCYLADECGEDVTCYC